MSTIWEFNTATQPFAPGYGATGRTIGSFPIVTDFPETTVLAVIASESAVVSYDAGWTLVDTTAADPTTGMRITVLSKLVAASGTTVNLTFANATDCYALLMMDCFQGDPIAGVGHALDSGLASWPAAPVSVPGGMLALVVAIDAAGHAVNANVPNMANLWNGLGFGPPVGSSPTEYQLLWYAVPTNPAAAYPNNQILTEYAAPGPESAWLFPANTGWAAAAMTIAWGHQISGAMGPNKVYFWRSRR